MLLCFYTMNMEQGLAECVVMARPICIPGEPDRITFLHHPALLLHHPALLQLFAVGERCGNIRSAVSVWLSVWHHSTWPRVRPLAPLSLARVCTCLLSLRQTYTHMNNFLPSRTGSVGLTADRRAKVQGRRGCNPKLINPKPSK